MTTTASDAGLVTPGGYVLPPGAPSGELAFLVGIAANESGFDYFRDQGSAGGTVGTYGGGAAEGFGEYQFTGPGSQQVQQAAAAGWAPAEQDRIAAGMAQGYYEQAKQGGATDEEAWAAATEGWYGPGTITPHGWSGPAPTVPGNDVLDPSSGAQSAADWANVKAALAGQPHLPTAWVYGPGNTGLSAAEVAQELAGHHLPASELTGVGSTQATLADVAPGGPWDPLNWPGEALGAAGGAAGSAVSSGIGDLASTLGPTLMKVGLYVVGAVAGAALIVLGIRDLSGAKAAQDHLEQKAGQVASVAAVAA